MERLGPIDRALVGLETDHQLMNVVATVVVEPPADVTSDQLFERFCRRVLDRLPLIPPLGRRLESTRGLSGPVWVDDDAVDLRHHVRRTQLPGTGDVGELADAVAVIASRPLDRSRPLWEFWFVDGLADGAVAIVAKVHHAALDGVTGLASLAVFFDLDEVATPLDAVPELRPAPPPTRWDLTREAVAGTLDWAVSLPMAVPRVAGFLGGLVGMRREDEAAVPLQAPRLSMNGALGPDRRVSLLQVARGELDEVRRFAGGTLNDVVVSVCAGALRRYLIEHDELPERPLVAAIPVTEHPAGVLPEGNAFSTMFYALPVHLPEPLDRLEFVRRSSAAAKTVHERSGRGSLGALLGLAPAALLRAPMEVATRVGILRHVPAPVNVVISNVPGSPVPLYMDGARVTAIFPMGPLFECCGVNVTVVSYLDRIGFGLQACPDLVGDLDVLGAAVPEALRELRKAALASISSGGSGSSSR